MLFRSNYLPMFFQRWLKWLTLIGALTASYVTLPKLWIKTGEGQVWRLDKDLPHWALGLGVVILGLLVFKVVTHTVFRLLMWAILIVIIMVVLASFGLPVWNWLGSLVK